MRFINLLFLLILFLNIPASIAAERELVKKCERCHGIWGLSRVEEIPRLAGMSQDFIVTALKRVEDKRRPCRKVRLPNSASGERTSMCEVAASISEQQKISIGSYFAQRNHKSARQSFDARLARKGSEVHERLCDKCHSGSGSDPQDDAGLLAGQWIPYLRNAFSDYDNKRRPMEKKMRRKYAELDQDDKEALIHFYASVTDPKSELGH